MWLYLTGRQPGRIGRTHLVSRRFKRISATMFDGAVWLGRRVLAGDGSVLQQEQYAGGSVPQLPSKG